MVVTLSFLTEQLTCAVNITAELKKQNELLRLLKEQRMVLAQDGLKFYRPAGKKHEAFHRAGEFKYRYVRSGNRFGKSELGAAEDVAWLVGERRWFGKDDAARYAGLPRRPVRVLLIVENWEKADDVFTNFEQGTKLGKLFKYIPKDAFVRVESNHGGHVECIYVKSIWGGVSMLKIDTIVSFKQSPQSSESSEWDAIHVDEPIPQEMWIAASRGLMDTGGKAWFTCTPLIHPWINRFFIPGGQALNKDGMPSTFGKAWVVTGSSYDNQFLEKENIDDFAKTLSREQRETRLHGNPNGGGGLVYGEFDSILHVYSESPKGWTAVDDPPKNYMIRLAIDTHGRKPQAVLFEATSPDGYVYYFAELFETRDVSATAARIMELVGGRNVAQTLFEPGAYNESPVDDSCLADVFMQHGVIGEKAPKDLKRGIIQTQAMWKERSISGKPTHFVSHLCSEFLYEIDSYVWNPKKPDSPIDQDDHMMENLYRLVLTHPGFVDFDEAVTSFVPQADVSQVSFSVPGSGELRV